MEKMTDLYWTQHINMDYTQKFEEKPTDGKNKTLLKFLDETACPFHSATELVICSNFMKFGHNSNFFK